MMSSSRTKSWYRETGQPWVWRRQVISFIADARKAYLHSKACPTDSQSYLTAVFYLCQTLLRSIKNPCQFFQVTSRTQVRLWTAHTPISTRYLWSHRETLIALLTQSQSVRGLTCLSKIRCRGLKETTASYLTESGHSTSSSGTFLTLKETTRRIFYHTLGIESQRLIS